MEGSRQKGNVEGARVSGPRSNRGVAGRGSAWSGRDRPPICPGVVSCLNAHSSSDLAGWPSRRFGESVCRVRGAGEGVCDHARSQYARSRRHGRHATPGIRCHRRSFHDGQSEYDGQRLRAYGRMGALRPGSPPSCRVRVALSGVPSPRTSVPLWATPCPLLARRRSTCA